MTVANGANGHANGNGAANATPTHDLAHFAYTLQYEDIPEAALHAARRHLLDTLGAIIAGSVQPVTNCAIAALVPFAGKCPSRDLGIPGRSASDVNVDLLTATYLSGTAAHGLEIDDGYRAGMMHPGSVIVPVVTLLGAQVKASGKDVLTAMIVGYEICCRLSATVHPRARWRGFHPTPSVGVFAAAATAGKLLGLSERQIEYAFGVAASKSSGLFTFLNGGDVKRLHGGHGAREGIVCALMAQNGVIGPLEALEFKEAGWLRAYAGGDNADVDYSKLEIFKSGGSSGVSPYAITDCYIKPYACCRHIHPIIDATFAACTELGKPALADLESVNIATYAVAEAHSRPDWRTEMTTAQMSIPFVIAAAISYGDITMTHFDEAHRLDPALNAACPRIRTTIDKELDAVYPKKRCARVIVTLKDGRSATTTVTDARGGAVNPLSQIELENKFRLLVEPLKGAKVSQSIIDTIAKLDSASDVGALLDTMIR